MPLRAIVTAIVLACTALPAAAQSWCSSPSLNATELAICTDPILGGLDIEMAALYEQVKAPGQRDWLRSRNACRADVFCIEAAYRSRIAELRALRDARPIARLRPWCGAARLNLTEQTICGNRTLANLDAAMTAVYGAARARPNDPEQVNWLRGTRDACGSDARCIRGAYVQRIVELGERLRLEGK
ncbi:MAG: hypothetical protein QNJ44_16490 [Rhodobacter sp.]|nr:hypothetical protein [Rhodobacter sp.]